MLKSAVKLHSHDRARFAVCVYLHIYKIYIFAHSYAFYLANKRRFTDAIKRATAWLGCVVRNVITPRVSVFFFFSFFIFFLWQTRYARAFVCVCDDKKRRKKRTSKRSFNIRPWKQFYGSSLIMQHALAINPSLSLSTCKICKSLFFFVKQIVVERRFYTYIHWNFSKKIFNRFYYYSVSRKSYKNTSSLYCRAHHQRASNINRRASSLTWCVYFYIYNISSFVVFYTL